MADTFIHRGLYETIPDHASPGLLFLKTLLPELDSLGPFDSEPALAQLLAPDATFTIGNNEPSHVSDVLAMLPQRALRLSKFRHDVETAWDVALPSGRRTVMYESTSKSIFKQDEEQQEVAVKEFNIVELGLGAGGSLVLLSARTFMDATPVMERMQLIK